MHQLERESERCLQADDSIRRMRDHAMADQLGDGRADGVALAAET